MTEKVKNKEKARNRFWFIWNLIETFVLFGGGVLSVVAGIIASPDNPEVLQGMENAIAYLVAGFAIFDALLRIIVFMWKLEKDSDVSPLVIAGFELSLGVLLVLIQSQHQLFTYTVVNLVAITLMVAGALLLTLAIFFLAKHKGKIFAPILEIVFAAVLVGVGIVIEILYNSNEIGTRERLVLIMIGVIIALAAIGFFVTLLINNHKAKKKIEEEEGASNPPVVVDYTGPETPEEPEDNPDIIDVEATDASDGARKPKQVSGPRAIGHKKD